MTASTLCHGKVAFEVHLPQLVGMLLLKAPNVPGTKDVNLPQRLRPDDLFMLGNRKISYALELLYDIMAV